MRALFSLSLVVILVLVPLNNSIGYAPSVQAAVGSISAPSTQLNIKTDTQYSMDSLYADIKRLTAAYPELRVEQLGKSYFGDPIYALVMGQGSKTLLVTAGIHGWEWVGSYLGMRGVAELLYNNAHEDLATLKTFADYRIVVIPVVNPDGVRIAQGERQPLVGNYGPEELRGWKANAWGVDLNRNFPHGYKEMARFLPHSPRPSFYPGTSPASEKETQSVMLALSKYEPEMLVDLHSSGNVVFWHYNQSQHLRRDDALAQDVAAIFRYGVSENLQQAIGGHLKDHFIGTYERPAFIVEIGSFANRYQIHKEFDELYVRFADFLKKLCSVMP